MCVHVKKKVNIQHTKVLEKGKFLSQYSRRTKTQFFQVLLT